MSRRKYRDVRQLPETKRDAGTRIYRGGQRLGVREAPRRRRLIDLTNRIPQPLTTYTNCVSQDLHVCGKNERERTASHYCEKKERTTRETSATRFDIRARLNPLRPRKVDLLNGGDKRISLCLVYRVGTPIIIKMLGQTFQLLFTSEIEI